MLMYVNIKIWHANDAEIVKHISNVSYNISYN